MYLADTNIFLEILLDQEHARVCRNFLETRKGQVHISDFSLHSVGVVLFRNNAREAYVDFIEDISGRIPIVSLPLSCHSDIVEAGKRYSLDFDDAYQYACSVFYGLTIVSYDGDFQRTPGPCVVPESL